MYLASFFDVNNNGIDVTDLAAILGFLALFIGSIAGLFRWSRKQLRQEIRDIVQTEIGAATRQIQPTANGGLSLPDVAKSTKRLEVMLGKIADSVGVSYDDLD